jgi:phosphatidylglycerol lysyltransferase
MSESIKLESPSGPDVRLLVRIMEPRVLGPIIGAAVVFTAALVVHRISGEIHLNDIRRAVSATEWPSIIQALGFTVVSFVAMGLYDVLAVRKIAPDRVPLHLAAFAGLVGYAISNAIGFHVLVGGPVRYRIYAASGLDAADVGRIVGISALTFSLGLAAVVGAALVADPAGLPFLDRVSPTADRVVGVSILLGLSAVILWLSTGVRELSILGWRLPFPGGWSASVQILVGAADIAAAAAALYVLLPADVTPGFAVFALLFVIAIIAGTASHSPGGLGVLEATMLIGLGAGTRPDVIAALIVFRLIYYLLPLGLAGTALLVFETYRSRDAVAAASGRTLAMTRKIIAPLTAVLVFLGGAVLLLSGDLPAEGDRMSVLRDVLPLPFAEASHMLASVTGLLLIVLARGLYRRIALARTAAILLLLSGAVFSLAKGLDWEEAGVLVIIATVLAFYRNVFYRKGDWRSFRPTPTWLALVAITLISLTFVGLLAYRHVEFSRALWWDFAWHGDAPRFLRATLALAILAGVVAADALINRPVQRRIGQVRIPDVVRKLLEQCPSTQANVALLRDKRFLISDDEQAFLMYGVSGRSWITMGDPVGDPQAGRELVWRFAEQADKAGARAAFYGVGPDMLTTYLDLGHAILKIGEVARVDLTDFTLDGPCRQNFRYADRRASREGLEFAIIPKQDVRDALPQLKGVSDAWLATKVGKEKGFSLGRFDEDYLCEFDCAVMRKEGEIVAFANLWRGAGLHELSVDLMRYRPGVSKVMMDALFARVLIYGKEAGYRWFNLGAAPLAGLADHPLASTWNRLGTFIYRRGDEIYNFKGLRAFKQKFDPVWTPQYLACPGGLAMPHILVDVASLISGGPIRMLKR